ncbi:MAG: response regulator [Elusimicrobia bacterium]|nr:response regulator [Elusimicrobiota bacterium]
MRSARILAVDDEPANVEILARYLASKGHVVTGAGDGEQALAAMKERSFDLVLLDLVLPGRTGLEIMAEILSLTRAPVVAMSGQSDDDTRHDAMLLGATGFLPKPLDLTALCALIDALPESDA